MPAWTAAIAHLEPPESRLGVAVFDAATGTLWGRRLDERFLMCSTFKLTLAALVLRRADEVALSLDERLSFTAADLVPHAPMTAPRLPEGRMTIGELAQAAVCQSDNVAANLLLRRLGGPQAYTKFCRELGDPASRLDRYEPFLNQAAPGDERDTTTPRATARLVARFFEASVLSSASQQLLRDWLIQTQTGLARLRAGLPKAWSVGDKTGTSVGAPPTSHYNDIACVWFTSGGPLVVAAYLETKTVGSEVRAEDELVLGRVGHVVGRWVNESAGR